MLLLPVPAQAQSRTNQTIDYINKARSHGRYCGDKYYHAVKPVKRNKKLTKAARRHAKDMARRDYFSHYSSRSGRSPFKRIRKAGYRYSAAGENIAAGYTDPHKVVDAWLDSPAHCKVIMNPKYKHVGVGISHNPNARYKTYWVADFARRK